MNRDRAKKMLPIVEALANGINIQYDYTDRGWLDIDCIMPNDDPKRYRIKPEPEVIYVNKLSDFCGGQARSYGSHMDASKAVPLSTSHDYEYIAKKFIECE